MTRRLSNARRERDQRPKRALSELRRNYFSRAGIAARRYGITFEQVVGHLWRTRGRSGHVSVRTVRYLDDLVHAIACTDSVALAWSDLTELHERPLVRRCRVQLDDTASIVAVRRLFAELRRSDDLHTYDGRVPLRAWLADSMMVLVTRERFAQWPAELLPFRTAEPLEVLGRVPAAVAALGPAVACHVAVRRF